MRLRGLVMVTAALWAMAGCSEPGGDGAFTPTGSDGGVTLDAADTSTEGDVSTGEDTSEPEDVDEPETDADAPEEDVPCTPDCAGKECGDDGCGGACGGCPEAAPHCVDHACRLPCEPACDGKSCGSDGCWGTCGECAEGLACVDGNCCTPDCDGKECGDDGCGGSCGTCPAAAPVCQDDKCACVPDCEGRNCGPDGCGGTCGECTGCDGPDPSLCHSGVCYAVCCPSCDGKECGDDGCGGVCGTCANDEMCSAGACVGPCDPNPCTNPPPDGCSPDGQSIYEYLPVGTCTQDGPGFTCDYAIDTTDCGEDVCAAGECVAGGDPSTYDYDLATWLYSLEFPGEGEDCCHDFDDDGEIDNGLADLLDSLAPLIGEDVDANAGLHEAIQGGDLTLLLEFADLTGLMSDTTLEVNGFLGTWDGTGYSTNMAGEGTFRVQPRSFAPGTGVPLSRFTDASVTDGELLATGGTFALPIFGLDLSMVDARLEGHLALSGDGVGLSYGELSGLVPMSDVAATLNEIAAGCGCLNIDGDAFELAAEDKLACTAAAKAATPSCTAGDGTCKDLDDNLGIACTAIGILKPDIDTDDSGKPDHFSVGLHVEGAGATITGFGQDQPNGTLPLTGCSGGAAAPWPLALLGLLALARRRRRLAR
ncbi:MAG: MYXO-CTERM sorting domain-containing protein [Myxococcota bacterium]